MRRRLYPIPNSSRVSWCFLVLESQVVDEERQITGWELAVGNSDKLVETKTSPKSSEESEVIADLMAALGQYQDDEPELYTFSPEALELLRTRLVVVDHDSLSLRGYHYIAIQELLEYFGLWWPEIMHEFELETNFDDQSTVTYGEFISADDLWELRQCIGSLLPPHALTGYAL